MLVIDQAISVIRRLIERSAALGEPIDNTIIAVGGTALSAHGIRDLTEDVDLYIPTFSDEVVYQLEKELKPIFGERFRLDVTATENLWGAILLRDINERSPVYERLDMAGRTFVVKALSIEDLFLVKLSADRAKDRQDLPLIAPRTNGNELIARFNTITQWHGNRQALLRYADEFIGQLDKQYGMTPQQSVPQLRLPPYVVELLWQSYYPDQDSPSTPNPSQSGQTP
ncbi:MAG: DUF6036 family nucleotidyltransferase [Candidatus Competibacteraceae bacterium]|jgi:hypothetical protein|nr:DUF6036 family nucleotidyltransferase [Candidatus Competibacteraceae bacterium]